jgi:hypothetical protein
MTIAKILTGHVSPETAFVVADYPYGFRLRCQMRYWLDVSKHGVRMMTQTSNPKASGLVWNNPKASTYCRFAGAMYLDENGHVQWSGLTEYTDGAEASAWRDTYGEGCPEASRAMMDKWVAAKVVYDAMRAEKKSETLYAGAAGFMTNVGGLITVPVAIPANLASVLLIQLRMIAAIAHLRGYSVSDGRVRTLAFLCLAGSGVANVLQEFGVNLGTRLTTRMIMQISGTTLTKINEAVGFRLVTKAGTTGLVNLTKVVPFIGGLVGGGFDAFVTRGIGAVAKEVFQLVEDDGLAPGVTSTEIVVPDC